jgi:putative flavoprotein involved in K+ transport
MSDVYDAVVIGAGQAGLATGYQLQRAGRSFVALEAGPQPVGSWPQYYDSLKLFSPARYSSLPGLSFPGDPERYPTRDEVAAYLMRYAAHFNLPVHLNTRVQQVLRDGQVLEVTTTDGRSYRTHSVIAATGSFHRPFIPEVAGREDFQGRVVHSFQYRSPESFQGQRVVVVGAGNSAVQIAVELANTAKVTLATREPVKFKPQVILGKDIHFWARLTGLDTLPLGYWKQVGKAVGVLDTGIYQAALAAGKPDTRPMFTHFTVNGVVWADGSEEAVDAVVFATGYRPGVAYLSGLGALDEAGRPLQRGGVSLNVPGLYYVGLSGQRSIASATLRGVGADAAHILSHLRR